MLIEKPAWDTFEPFVIEGEDDTVTSSLTEYALKLTKLLAHALSFVLVLCLGVLSKLMFHLMANMTKIDKAVSVCTKDKDLSTSLDHDKRYHSLLAWNSPERIAWTWALFAVMITPDVLTFLKSARICLFKNYQKPDLITMLTVRLD